MLQRVSTLQLVDNIAITSQAHPLPDDHTEPVEKVSIIDRTSHCGNLYRNPRGQLLHHKSRNSNLRNLLLHLRYLHVYPLYKHVLIPSPPPMLPMLQ